MQKCKIQTSVKICCCAAPAAFNSMEDNHPLPLCLQPKVLVPIFEFLTFRERLIASRTCTTWYQAAFSPEFCAKVRICLQERRAAFLKIEAYQKYRNARVTISECDGMQRAITGFVRTAPVESLQIYGTIRDINTLLDGSLLRMNQLSALEVWVNRYVVRTDDVLKISHPSLKSVKIDGYPANAIFKIDCPNLTDLRITSETESESKKFVQLMVQLQQQLQCLEIDIHGDQQLDVLADAKLSSLNKLSLHFKRISRGIKPSFGKMLNLVELCLRDEKCDVTLGEELGALTKLSKLVLILMRIDAKGFAKAVHEMKELKDLSLDRCEYVPNTESCSIVSKTLRNLSIGCQGTWEKVGPVMLPHCAAIKSLDLTCHGTAIDGVLKQACNSYPLLEKLHISAKNYAGFRSSTSFSHLQHLKFLKELHLTGLSLGNVDWTECEDSLYITVLRLKRCAVHCNEVLQFVESMGPRCKLFCECIENLDDDDDDEDDD